MSPVSVGWDTIFEADELDSVEGQATGPASGGRPPRSLAVAQQQSGASRCTMSATMVTLAVTSTELLTTDEEGQYPNLQ